MPINVARAQSRLNELNVEAVLVHDITNVQWLTGFTGSFGYVLLGPNPVFISDSRYGVQAHAQVKDCEVIIFSTPKQAIEVLVEQVQRAGVTKLGFEPTLTYAVWEQWSEKFAPCELVSAGDILPPLRMIKSPVEIARTRNACDLADVCFGHVQRMLQAGVSEYDIGLDIEFFFRRQGAGLAFEPIVVSGANSAKPHGRPSEKKLEKGDFVTLDFGCVVDGYCSDLTRTVVIGKASDRHREIYDQVLKAQLAAIAALKPGANGREVDQLSRAVLDEKDLSKHFGHSLGHGLGRVVHDPGGLTSVRDQAIEAGQIWTVEPGVYIEGFGGVRIEDDILITESGNEVLTRSPKDLMVLG